MNARLLAAGLALSSSLAAPSAQAQEDFSACLKELREQAPAREVSPRTFERYTEGLAPDMEVVALLDYQPEFRTPIWDYLAGLVDEERVADGQAMLRQWDDTLRAIEARFGVDREAVLAVWGVETNFGRNFGKRPLVSSLATLSCFGRRQRFFRGEFFTALRILQEGHIAPEQFRGSWAGAFGHTQFMPSTFMRTAVDFDGDGRRDLVGSVPDALASTANFLAEAGWRLGEPWGFEVALPPGFDASLSGRRAKRPLSEWAERGVTRVDGTPLSADATAAGLLLPAGAAGPAFLVLRNFDALHAYNAAESYALALAHLSDRLRGAPPLATPWPTDDPGLSRAERREVQRLLSERGYDVGQIDGLIGAQTRAAISDVQARLGWDMDGRAGRRLLEHLRRHAPPPAFPPPSDSDSPLPR